MLKRLFNALLGLAALVAIAMIFAAVAYAQEAAAVPELSIGDRLMRDVVPQAIAVLSTTLGVLVVFLRTKVGKGITEKVGNEALGSALKWAADLTFELVLAATQTEVEQLKLALADGKITKTEYKAQLEAVKAALLAKLREMTMGRLLGSGAAKSLAEVDTINSDLIESAVVKAKALAPNPPKPPQS